MYGYLEYLPDYLKEFKEYIVLGEATDGDIKLVQDSIIQVNKNRFIEDADLSTITRWERLFNIQNTNMTLELRQQQVIAYLNMRVPITEKRLKIIIENIAQCVCEINVKHSEFRFEIVIINANRFINFPMIFTQVHKLKPANMLFDVIVETQVELGIKVSSELFRYRYNFSGKHNVGTLPSIAFIGCNRDTKVDLDTEAKGYIFKYDKAGKLPYVNTEGVLKELNVDLDTEGKGYIFKYDLTGEEVTGAEPYINIEGIKAQDSCVPEIKADSFKILYRYCGTSNTRR